MSLALDRLDEIAAQAFEGFVVRKDLVRRFKAQYPVPTYVVEFLLGRYCSSTEEQEIQEGLQIVERQLSNRSVRAGEEELFKARARENGSVKVIDLIQARLDAKTDSYLATLPSLKLNDVRIQPRVVKDNERMLTGGFYAEVELEYDAAIAQEKSGRPFGVASLREIQLSKREVLEPFYLGRELFTAEEWKRFLIRSVGLEPNALPLRGQDMALMRMVSFVERNYNMVELGPRGTGKSHLFQQVSPYAHLVSGGKATVARMFVNNATGQRGLVCQHDVVCFDEVSGVSFDQKDGVNIMKGYMESGEFSRGKENIRADGSIVMVGNFEVDVEHQQRVGHLFGPLPPEMRNDTAFMDRIHCYLAGWDIPKLSPLEHFTDHFGLVSDFLSECCHRLRSQGRGSVFQNCVFWGGALSGRDITAVQKTVAGLLKLLHPNPDTPVPEEDIEWAVRLALESRRRVKEQQKRIGCGGVPQHALQLPSRERRRGEVRRYAERSRARTRSEQIRCRLDRSGRSAQELRTSTRAFSGSTLPQAPGPAFGSSMLQRLCPSGRASNTPSRTYTLVPRSWLGTEIHELTSSLYSCGLSTPRRMEAPPVSAPSSHFAAPSSKRASGVASSWSASSTWVAPSIRSTTL